MGPSPFKESVPRHHPPRLENGRKEVWQPLLWGLILRSLGCTYDPPTGQVLRNQTHVTLAYMIEGCGIRRWVLKPSHLISSFFSFFFWQGSRQAGTQAGPKIIELWPPQVQFGCVAMLAAWGLLSCPSRFHNHGHDSWLPWYCLSVRPTR